MASRTVPASTIPRAPARGQAARAAFGWLLVVLATAFVLGWAAPSIPLGISYASAGAFGGALLGAAWIRWRRVVHDRMQFAAAQLDPRVVGAAAEDADHLARASLEALLDLRRPLPAMSGYGMAGSTALFVASAVLGARPRVVVEFGSGISTVLIAKALERNGEGRLVSIDHSGGYLEQTRALLEAEGVAHRVELRVGPLRPWRGGGSPWYDAAVLEGIEQADLVLVDGPPASSGRLARYPAGPEMAGLLRRGGLLLLDDVNRAAESRIARLWLEELPLRELHRLRSGKGLMVFERG